MTSEKRTPPCISIWPAAGQGGANCSRTGHYARASGLGNGLRGFAEKVRQPETTASHGADAKATEVGRMALALVNFSVTQFCVGVAIEMPLGAKA